MLVKGKVVNQYLFLYMLSFVPRHGTILFNFYKTSDIIMRRFLTIVRGGYNISDNDRLSIGDVGKHSSSALHRQV